MDFHCTITIDRSRDKVWKLFDNPKNLKEWQPSLQTMDHQSGEPGQEGAVTKLTYLEDGRLIVLMETILSRTEGSRFSARYDAGSAVNTIHNAFSDLEGGKTHWVLDSTVELRGALKLAAPFLKGSLQKRFETDMKRFKTFAERSGATANAAA